MIEKLVVGTLTTLNAVLTPMGSTQAISQERTSHSLTQPLTHSTPGRCASRDISVADLHLTIDRIGETHVTARIMGTVCSLESTSKSIDLRMNLPSELMDSIALDRLPIGLAYIVPGIPSVANQMVRPRIKLTRLAEVGDLTPIEIEWLPMDPESEETAHEPLTVWIHRHPGKRTVSWDRILLPALKPEVDLPLQIGPLRNEARSSAKHQSR